METINSSNLYKRVRKALPATYDQNSLHFRIANFKNFIMINYISRADYGSAKLSLELSVKETSGALRSKDHSDGSVAGSSKSFAWHVGCSAYISSSLE